MKQIDLLWREARRMRAQIENVFLTVREDNLQRQLRLGIAEMLPCHAGKSRLFDNRRVR